MGLSINCCLKLNISPPPPLSSPSSHATKTTQATWPKKERSWRSQCVLGLACVIVGLEVDNSIGMEGIAIAENMQRIVQINEKAAGNRWSDTRACPPWRVNSLETIVPENLPRLTARRKWEGVGFTTTTAPTLKVAAVRTSNPSCFTM